MAGLLEGRLNTINRIRVGCHMHEKSTEKSVLFKFGGSGEIRTHGGLQTLDGFQDRCIKPLCHASVS